MAPHVSSFNFLFFLFSYFTTTFTDDDSFAVVGGLQNERARITRVVIVWDDYSIMYWILNLALWFLSLTCPTLLPSSSLHPLHNHSHWWWFFCSCGWIIERKGTNLSVVIVCGGHFIIYWILNLTLWFLTLTWRPLFQHCQQTVRAFHLFLGRLTSDPPPLCKHRQQFNCKELKTEMTASIQGNKSKHTRG